MGLHGWEKDRVPDYTTSVALNEDTNLWGFYSGQFSAKEMLLPW
jgi:hypothetical protein